MKMLKVFTAVMVMGLCAAYAADPPKEEAKKIELWATVTFYNLEKSNDSYIVWYGKIIAAPEFVDRNTTVKFRTPGDDPRHPGDGEGFTMIKLPPGAIVEVSSNFAQATLKKVLEQDAKKQQPPTFPPRQQSTPIPR